MADTDDDSDMVANFRAMAEESQQRRADHREHAPKVLAEARIPFQAHNGGAHLVVTAFNTVVDFWPGTGLWIVRSTKRRGRGIRKLINLIGTPKL